jgi:SAM-dependent methyltransferase
VQGTERYWETVWRDRVPEEMSWFEATPTHSFELISRAAPDPAAAIIDVGGGASRLVDELLGAGHGDLTVLDISEAALEAARQRLGALADRVDWVHADVLTHRFGRTFRVWHDRAVFHFLVDPDDRHRYVERLLEAIEPEGDVIISTFGPEGPTQCSGLPVQRYGRAAMIETLGPQFELRSYDEAMHRTPSGVQQQFAFCHFRRRASF